MKDNKETVFSEENIEKAVREFKNLNKKIDAYRIGTARFSQDLLNKFFSLKSFIYTASDPNQSQFRELFDSLLIESRKFSDSQNITPKNFDIYGFFTKTFELGIYHFLKRNNFTTAVQEEKYGNPDFICAIEGIRYSIECKTATSSLCNKFFLKVLPIFSSWFEAAKIICKKSEENNIKFKRNGYKWYYLPRHTIEEQFLEKNKQGQEEFCKILGKNSLEEAIVFFEEILDIILYTWMYYEALISEEMVGKLKSLFLIRCHPTSSTLEQTSQSCKDWAENIYKVVEENIEKEYFKNDTPVVLFISLALRHDSFENHHKIHAHISEIKKSLTAFLENLIKKAPNLRNLYALIIDTTHYNWFASYAEQQYGACFKEGFNNAFICLYNKRNELVIKQTKQGTLIFKNLIPNIDSLDILEMKHEIV